MLDAYIRNGDEHENYALPNDELDEFVLAHADADDLIVVDEEGLLIYDMHYPELVHTKYAYPAPEGGN